MPNLCPLLSIIFPALLPHFFYSEATHTLSWWLPSLKGMTNVRPWGLHKQRGWVSRDGSRESAFGKYAWDSCGWLRLLGALCNHAGELLRSPTSPTTRLLPETVWFKCQPLPSLPHLPIIVLELSQWTMWLTHLSRGCIGFFLKPKKWPEPSSLASCHR